MIDQELRRRLSQEIKNLLPLFRYLVLQTETHAFCLALSAAALIGFFPPAWYACHFQRHPALGRCLHRVSRQFSPIPRRPGLRQCATWKSRLSKWARATNFFSAVGLTRRGGYFHSAGNGTESVVEGSADRPYWLNQLMGLI